MKKLFGYYIVPQSEMTELKAHEEANKTLAGANKTLAGANSRLQVTVGNQREVIGARDEEISILAKEAQLAVLSIKEKTIKIGELEAEVDRLQKIERDYIRLTDRDPQGRFVKAEKDGNEK